MTEITGIDIKAQGNALLFFAVLFVVLATVFIMYRKTLPPQSLYRRILLAVIRSAAVTICAAMLILPVFSISFQSEEKPSLAVLIDSSGSMSIKSEQEDRAGKVRGFLRSTVFEELEEVFDLSLYSFERSLTQRSLQDFDSISFSVEGTDISAALRNIVDNDSRLIPSNILLISDGRHNTGADPVITSREIDIPVYSIGAGMPGVKSDLYISQVRANNIVYTGDSLDIEIIVGSSGYDQTVSSVVSLIAGRELVASETVSFSGDGRERSIVLPYFAASEGIKQLDVQIAAKDNELTRDNNSWEFNLKVLESRVRILMLSGRPSQDYAFLKRSLDEVNEFTVTAYVMREGGMYSGNAESMQEELGSADVIVLTDFPGNAANSQITQMVARSITSGKPVMFIRGRTFGERENSSLKEALRISRFIAGGTSEEIYYHILPEYLTHQVFRIAENRRMNESMWDRLPPLFTGGDIPVPDGETVIAGVVDGIKSGDSRFVNDTPMIFMNRSGGRKSLVFNMYNLWRWNFMTLRDRELTGLYDALMENAVRWLINIEDSKTVRFFPVKEFWQSGEDIIIGAQVYTENFEPVDDADVSLLVRRNEESLNAVMQSLGNGRYEAKLSILEPGEYTFTGEASKNERILGADNGSFIIGRFSIESQNAALDSLLLHEISSATNGKYLNIDHVGSLPELLDSKKVIRTYEKEIYLWDKWWLLILVVLLFGTEWFLRKRWGML